jgi:nucleotide-binding universal stress UspA family protein
MIKLQHILVATDFSETSDSALDYGRALARTFDASLHVLHVVEYPALWTTAEGATYDFAMVQEQMEEDARKRLAAIVGLDNGQSPKTTALVKAGASPAFVIADYAKEAQIDLIVMGTHGRGLVGHLFVGSVAERVVRIAPCPVLTLRHPEHEFVLPDALQTVAAARA